MTLDALSRRVRTCRKCRLWKTRTNAVPGEGRLGARLFLVGEAPGRQEDELGRPFVGAAGRILDEGLEKASLKREDVYITSVLRCRPPRNRNPRSDEIENCRPYLVSYIEEVNPVVVLALGAFAHKVLSGKPAKVSDARKILGEYDSRVLVTTYHPAAVLRNPGLLRTFVSDLKRAKELSESDDVTVLSGPARRGKRTVHEKSAGGVVLRRRRVLLIHKRSERLWCLPKGHIEHGESTEEAALREMREETGLRSLKLERRLQDIEYEYYWPQDDANHHKTVVYFLTSAKGSEKPILEKGFDSYRWCPENEAIERLHYRNDRKVVKSAFKAK